MALPTHTIDITGPIGRTWPYPCLRPAIFGVAVAIGLCVGTQAAAQRYSAREIGRWTIAASKDEKGCFLTRNYERAGGTALLLGLDIDGANRLSVRNSNWSIKPKDEVRLDFRLTHRSYAKHFAVGIVSDGKPGFVTSFDPKFPSDFATSAFLHVFRGDVPVEQLSLDGSGAAVAELRKCVDFHRAKPAADADDTVRSDAIPADPFAPEPTRKSMKQRQR